MPLGQLPEETHLASAVPRISHFSSPLHSFPSSQSYYGLDRTSDVDVNEDTVSPYDAKEQECQDASGPGDQLYA